MTSNFFRFCDCDVLKMLKAMCVVAGMAVLVACEPGAGAGVQGRTAQQEEIARRACIAAELVAISDEEIDTIEATLPPDIETLPQQGIWQAQIAALQFAQALYDHTLLRRAAMAHADTAVNHATTSADSARHMDLAARYLPREPEPGRLEANVMSAYERRFAAIRADEDHRCNWDI